MAHGGPEQSRAGLDVELQPLREALQEVQELRRAALLWLGLFERALFWLGRPGRRRRSWRTTSKRPRRPRRGAFSRPFRAPEDFGGPVLAAQWRAAVKEVQKPCDID